METETLVTRMELPSSLADRYGDLELVGRGGMGDVYRAMDRTLQRPVALKVVRSDLVDQMEILRRFRREVRAMQQVSHPNLVSFLDLHQEEGRRILVMAYVEGRTLESRLAAEGPLPIDEALACIDQCCEALQAIHEAGLLHRDVKPGNVMLGDDGLVRLMDFGLVRFEDSAQLTALTATGSFVGTARYLAPEVLAGAPPDVRADLYGLGLVFYEALTGVHPLEDMALDEILSAEKRPAIPAPSSKVPGLDPTFDEIFAALVAADPTRRPASATELAAALRAWQAGDPLPGRRVSDRLAPVSGALASDSEAAPSKTERTPPPRGVRERTLPRRPLAILSLLLAMLGLGWWIGRRDAAPPPLPALHDLAVHLEQGEARVVYGTASPMDSAVVFENPAVTCHPRSPGKVTSHEIRCAPLVEGRRYRFRVLYPEGRRSVPHAFSTGRICSELSLEMPSERQLLLSWTTSERAQTRVEGLDEEGRVLRELDVFTSREGREHLLRLAPGRLPPLLRRSTKVGKGSGLHLVHHDRIDGVDVFAAAWKGLPLLASFARPPVPEFFGGRREPRPPWPADGATLAVTRLLPLLERSLAGRQSSVLPLTSRLSLHGLLDTMARIAPWAPDEDLRRGLARASARRRRFFGPRPIDEEAWVRGRTEATWRFDPPTPVLLVPRNFDRAYVRSLMHLVADTVLQVPCLPEQRFAIEMDEESARRPHDFVLRVGNFDPANSLRLDWNGRSCHVLGRGKRNFDFIPFSSKRQRRLALRTVASYEEQFPPQRYAVRIPPEFLKAGRNVVTLSAWAMESRSMFFPGLGGAYLRPSEN